VFNLKATEFREAVSSLLGFKVGFDPNQVRLTSLYDKSIDLKFRSTAGNQGTMQLVGAGGGVGLDGEEQILQLKEFWVDRRQSIPCFLASLTLEAFERTTMGRSAGWGEPS